jgi:DNA-binding MarR family transcriptional regulator
MTEIRSAAVEALSTDLTRAIRFVGALKQRYGVSDPASVPLLFRLLDGSKRATELAELLHVDLSVVSRQVTSLAGRGLVVKTRESGDRRASLVEITDAGRTLTTDVERIRTGFIHSLVADWDDADVTQFAHYLHRLTETLEHFHGAPSSPLPHIPGEI